MGETNMSFPRFKITCAECGAEDTMTFQPDPDRKVYYRDCWHKRKQAWQERSRRLAETRRKLEADG